MSTPSDVFVIFYCWQSDTPQNHARFLIREALDQAADRLSNDVDIPFKIVIDSDTLNESGMCDIPATILKKIQQAGAVVADLTFVAKTEAGKHCPNPNVLFELGYAFRAIGPERLICVMNEKHGPRNEQIFDVAHRRHPVSYTSPGDSKNRRNTIERLSIDLEAAIRPIVALGVGGGVDGDDLRRHESDRAKIESFWEAQRTAKNAASLSVSFRPVRYQTRRWPDVSALESLIRHCASRTGNHDFPPHQNGNAAMEWGAYNDTYSSCAWALTYSGQVWLGIVLAGWDKIDVPRSDLRFVPAAASNRVLEAREWFSLEKPAEWIRQTFSFAHRFAAEFANGEVFEWSLVGRNLDLKYMANHLSGTPLDLYGPSRSPRVSRKGQSTVAEFRSRWPELCLDVAKEVYDLFERLPRDNISSLLGLQR